MLKIFRERDADALEKRYNDWLAANPGLRVTNVLSNVVSTALKSGGSGEVTRSMFVLWVFCDYPK